MPLEQNAFEFATEEYKSIREEQLMQVRDMDALLFRTFGFCALIYSLAFVDISSVMDAPDLDGGFLTYLVWFPPVIILFAGLDYVRRLGSLILKSRYLARLEAEIYSTDRTAIDWVYLATDRKVRILSRAPRQERDLRIPSGDVAASLEKTLGYSVFQLVGKRFNEANRLRKLIWLLMFVASIGLAIHRQFFWQ